MACTALKGKRYNFSSDLKTRLIDDTIVQQFVFYHLVVCPKLCVLDGNCDDLLRIKTRVGILDKAQLLKDYGAGDNEHR